MNAKTVLDMMSVEYKIDVTNLKKGVLNRKPYIGISYPKLKLIASRIQQDNPIQFLESNDCSVYELEILQTYVIGTIQNINLALYYFSSFALQAKEWSVVDSLCQKFVITKKHRKIVLDLLKQYATMDDEFMQRIVAVMLLSHYFVDEYIDQSIDLLDNLRHVGYYTKMAVAWAFATMMAKYPEKCLHYMQLNKLDIWTHNKAIQKMIESYRISVSQKSKLSMMKRLVSKEIR